jgi:hypothetical protein
MTAPGCWVPGQIGNALSFDGTNDYVNLGNNGSLQLTGDMTITVWAKLATGNTGNYYGIAGKYRSSGSYAGFALTRHSSNYFYFWTANGSADYVASNTTYTDTNWHHIVGVRRSGTTYLYIDGVQQTATNTRAISDSGDYAFIGRQYSDYDGRYFNGIIDDVRIYNRALTAVEIAQLALGPVSGGAGYIKQSTAGLSSGTPTFSLTASNEARMLTIAIAPAGNSGYDCCGDYIQP